MNRFENEILNVTNSINKEVEAKQFIERDKNFVNETINLYCKDLLPKLLREYINAKKKVEPIPLKVQIIELSYCYKDYKNIEQVGGLIGDEINLYFVGEYITDNYYTKKSWYVDENLNFYNGNYGITLGSNPIGITQSYQCKTIYDYCRTFLPLIVNAKNISIDDYLYNIDEYKYFDPKLHTNGIYNSQKFIEIVDKQFSEYLKSCMSRLNKSQYQKLKVVETPKKEGCYIATAIYGSYEADEVIALRDFRDNILKNSFYGRIFIKLYYFISPFFVKWMKNKFRINKVVKSILDNLVIKISDTKRI